MDVDGAPISKLTSGVSRSRSVELGHYLRTDVKIEPLVNRWYAWHHLIAPVQRALNLTHRQLDLLTSFTANPRIHTAAASDPDMLCAPFVQLGEADVAAVRALTVETKEKCAALLGLAADLGQFEERLQTSAKGFSLDALYAELPEGLRGLIELSYDAHSRPLLRVREELLYEDERYSSAFQEVLLHRTADTERKFFLNTPRIPGSGAGEFLPLKFADARIDALALARIKPTSPLELSKRLDGLLRSETLESYLTTKAPERRRPRFDGDGVRIRYFGHACVLLQTAQVSVLIDPRFAFDRDESLATLTFDDLPDFIDYVFISHAHQDHFCMETLVQLRRRISTVLVPRNSAGSVADPSMKLALKSLGFDNVRVCDDLDAIEIPEGSIVSLPFPGEHCDLDVRTKHCAAVYLQGRKFLFLVDSDAVDLALYRKLAPRLKDTDALFIGMECHGAPLSWLYGPLLMKPVSRRDDESRRGSGSNCERAWRVIREIGCSNVYVYAMGMEPWNQHLLGLQYAPDSIQITESNKLVEQCRSAGIPAERLRGCREFLF